MGTKGQTINSQIFKKQSMKNKEQMQGVIRAAGNGMQRGSSYGADSMGTPRYANGGSYDPKGPTRMGMGNYENPNGESPKEERSNDLNDNPVASRMSSSDKYYDPNDFMKNIGLGGGASNSSSTGSSNSSSTGSSSASLDNIRAAQDVLKSPRGVSITNYEAGKARADAGRASKASGKAGYGRGQAHDAAGTSMSDYRAARKLANQEIKAGKKQMRQANKKSVTFDGIGGKTVINNRKQNLRDLNSGTKVGNALRGLFGKGNR